MCLAYTKEKKLYAWGYNNNGQLGIGDNSGSKLKIGDAVNEMGAVSYTHLTLPTIVGV